MGVINIQLLQVENKPKLTLIYPSNVTFPAQIK